jgi:isoleucyl-tRNA synthetase
MFTPVPSRQSFPELEKEILQYWEENNSFQKSIEIRENSPLSVFYDGPPFATGLPHYGHIIGGILKDTIPRYKTMKGYKVLRRFGWDCHGLPIENIVEKKLELKSKKDIEEFGIHNFNEECRNSVLTYTKEWEKTVEKMGRWVDFENDYKTMNKDFMESVWWVFSELWKKDLVYQGLKPMHICPRCVTPLSNFEVNQPGAYQDLTDISATVLFQLENEKNTFFLSWTTTPWTLPGNILLAVSSHITYVYLKKGENTYIIAENRKEAYAELKDAEVLKTVSGKELISVKYTPLFSSFAHSTGFYVTEADFVTDDSGTGIVHIAPAFGEDDLLLSKRENIDAIKHVKMDGHMTDEILSELQAVYPEFPIHIPVKSKEDNRRFDENMIKVLEKKGNLFAKENIRHSYPTCWRCETPLLNYATESWFIRVEQLKDKLLKNNEKINWVPDHLQNGRFGKWLEGARDWAVSRNRYWGTPLPVWENIVSKKQICIGSVGELEKYTGKKHDDIHKHFMDMIEFTLPSEEGVYKRIPEVFDCWFESGSMPYAEKHYPFENQENFKIPAEFIAEGIDQTRGWFYTLHVLSTALFDTPAFKNVVVNGTILAEDGKKMSKRLKNYPDPLEIINTYGADAMRFYLLGSPAIRGEELRFSERQVDETIKTVLLPLQNAYSFFVTYANADNWDIKNLSHSYENPLDIWMISELEILKKTVSEGFESYKIYKATEAFPKFFDNLTNWYIRRSRRRFWDKYNTGNEKDKNDAYSVLYTVLKETAFVLAPICPFITERIFQNLCSSQESIHHQNWPQLSPQHINKELSQDTDQVQRIISLGLSLRKSEKFRVRQPLSRFDIAIKNTSLEKYADIIKEELNVKEVRFLENPEELAETVVVINAKELGPRVGAKVQTIISETKQGNFIFQNGKCVVAGETLLPNEFSLSYQGKLGKKVASDLGVVVSFDFEITETLLNEGKARDFVHIIQDLRKEAGYEVSDRIFLEIQGADEVVPLFQSYIETETLSQIQKIETPDITREENGVTFSLKK